MVIIPRALISACLKWTWPPHPRHHHLLPLLQRTTSIIIFHNKATILWIQKLGLLFGDENLGTINGTVPLTNQQNNMSSSSVNANGNGVGVTKERRPSYRRKSMTPSRRSSVVMESAKELEEKPFHCHICSKSFKRSEHLKRHVRSVHSNERPFACHICDKKFSRSDNLSQHIKTHKKHGDIWKDGLHNLFRRCFSTFDPLSMVFAVLFLSYYEYYDSSPFAFSFLKINFSCL